MSPFKYSPTLWRYNRVTDLFPRDCADHGSKECDTSSFPFANEDNHGDVYFVYNLIFFFYVLLPFSDFLEPFFDIKQR